ncbi:putative Derlin-1 [Gigaspora margarita]|uniref:Derlin n=1 Tax=Gigaspora margarita TaxID=4874 RepID=A0A8H4AWC0_GIGMA|nr:putative Derlin-1 [Gigaspora margarita]
MSRQPAQPENEIVAWYRSIPTCTRFLFTSFLAITLAGNFGLVNVYSLLYYPRIIFTKYQIWRIYTPFFYYTLDLNGAIQLYLLYRYSSELETTRFIARTADYVYFLLVEAGLILIFGWLLGIMLLNQCLVMAIIYLWSQEFRESIVTFIFGIRFKGSYFPWVLLAFDVLRGGDVLSTAVGIIAGHIYYYLQELYPATGGSRLLNTPQLLYRYFPPSSSGTRTSFGTAFAPRNQNTAGEGSTHIWGRGQRLGSS